MAQYLPLPDGSYLKLQEGESPAAGLQRAQQKYPEAFASQAPAPKPEGGFIAAAKAGATELGGGLSALAGKLGLKDEAKAEAEYQAAKKRAAEIFKPTEEGWTEAPFTKFKELLGGSVPYMAAPLAAGAAAAALPVTGTAAALTTLGAAGLTSVGQFTATNLSRQLEEGKKLAETDLGAAALAAVPQAALDTLSMRMIPGIGRIFGQAGVKITAENAKEIAEQGLKKTLIDYTAKTGKTAGIEGATEAAQQVFERLQAGLSITDPQARQEYFDSFIGGAVLGGTLAPVGRAVERGGEKREARGLLQQQAQEERAAAAKAETERKKDPAYALQLDADYQAAVERMKELQAAVPKRPAKDALPEEQMAYRQAVDARNAHLKDVLQPLAAEYVPRKAEIAQLKERQRVEAMSPLDYMLEQTETAPIKGIAPGEAPLRTEADTEIFPTISAPAPEAQYAQQQMALAQQQDLGTFEAKDFAEYLMQDPAMAQRLVEAKTAIPGVSKKESDAILGGLKLQLQDRVKQARAATQEELQQRQADLKAQQLPAETDPLAMWKASVEETEDQATEELLRPNFETLRPSGPATVTVAPGITPMQNPGTLLKRLDDLTAARDKAAADAETAFAAGNKELGVKKSQEREAAQSALNNIEQAEGTPRALVALRKTQDTALMDAAQLIDDLRVGRTLGGPEAGTASSTPQTLINQINKQRDAFVTAAVQEAAATRRLFAKALTQEEAETAAKQMRDVFNEWVTRSMAQPAKAVNWVDQMLAQMQAEKAVAGKDLRDAPWVQTMKQDFIRAQMTEALTQRLGRQRMEEIAKGTAELKGAETELPVDTRRAIQSKASVDFDRLLKTAQEKALAQSTDPRPLEERRFGAYRAATQVLQEQLQGIAAKLKEVPRAPQRVEPTLKMQFPETEAAKVAEASGETAQTLEGSLRRRRDYVGGLIDQAFQTRKVPGIAQMLLTRVQDFLQKPLETRVLNEETGKEETQLQYRGTTGLLDAAENIASRILRGQNVERNDLVALRDEIRAESMRPGEAEVAGEREGQRELFPAEERRALAPKAEQGALGTIREKPEAFEAVRAKSAAKQQRADAAAARGEKLTQDIKRELDRIDTERQQALEARVDERRDSLQSAWQSAVKKAKDSIIAARRVIQKDKLKGLKTEIDAIRSGGIEGLNKETIDRLLALRQQADDLVTQFDAVVEAAEFLPLAQANKWVAFERGALDQAQKALEASRTPQTVSALAQQQAALQRAETARLQNLKGEEKAAEAARMRAAQQGLGLPGVRREAGKVTPIEPEKTAEQKRAEAEESRAEARAAAAETAAAKQAELGELEQRVLDLGTQVAEREAAQKRARTPESKARIQEEIDALNKEATLAQAQLEALQEGKPRRKGPATAPTSAALGKRTPLRTGYRKVLESASEGVRKEREGETRVAGTLEREERLDSFAVGNKDIFFSRGKPAEGRTKEEVTQELERALGQKGLLGAQNVVTIVGSVADLRLLRSLPPGLKDALDNIPADAKGFVYDGKAYLIAENIGKDHALGVLLHEVGAHIGFRNFFNTAQYNALVETVKRWGKLKGDSLEARIGRAAKERVEAAETPDSQVNDELLAYAVEEAFNAGVEPAGVKSGNAVQNWLRSIIDSFKKALENFGLAPQKLKVGDLVNMAYGAANLELRGTWHGTGKPFKEFDFQYMSTGEGAQVYGWGTYRAQSYGTAKYYKEMVSNNLANAVHENFTYKGKTFDAMLRAFDAKKITPDERFVFGYLENMEPGMYRDFVVKDKAELTANLKKAFAREEQSINNRIKNSPSRYISQYERDLKELAAVDFDAFDMRDYSAFSNLGAMARVLSTRPDEAYFVLDLPLSKQSDYVKAAVADAVAAVKTPAGRARFQRILENRGFTSEALPQQLESLAKSYGLKAKDASLMLRSFGLAGFKYLDRGSRRGPIGKASKFNYVDFYDKDEGPQIVAWDIDRVGPAEDILFSRNLPTAARVADSLIAKEKGWVSKLKDNFLGMGFRTQFVDKLAPSEEALKRGGTDPTKALQAMYYLRMYDQRMHFTSQSITEGVPELVEKTRRDGTIERLIETKAGANIQQIVDILKGKAVVKAAGSPDAANKLFTLYLAAIRGERVGYDKLNFKVSEADIKAARAEIEADPTLKKAFDEARDIYNQYNRNLLEFSVQTGALSRAQANEYLRNNDYIPYYRMRDGVAEMVIGNETPIRIGNLKDSPHLKELVGGDEAIFDFLTSSVQNTSMLLDMATKNLATKNLMFELRDVGLATVAKVPKSGKTPEGAVTFKRDGEDHYAVVDTDTIGIDSDLLVKGLAGIPTMFPAFVRVLGVPARLLRRVVVASPVYMARQLFRDSLAAALTSGADITPVLGSLKQIGKPNALQSRGITGGQVFTGMPEDVTRMLKDMQAGKISVTNGLSYLEAKAAQVDALTRKAQYESYLKQGLSEMEATYMALESMNFSKRGLSPTMHMVSTLIPFFNAQIQGLDVLYKSFTGQMPLNERLAIREKLWTRGLMLAGLSMAYALAMQDDETYKNAKPEEKYGNWFVQVPGFEQMVRLPIPFELGYIFKALPEALVNTLSTDQGGEDAMKAFKHIAQQMVPGASSYFLPQAVKPALETLIGTSLYTGRSIESTQEQMMEPGYRYRDNTTEAAKFVGELTGFSPVKMEFLIRGYTGSMGMALLGALSAPFGGEGPEAATKRASDMPVVGTLFQPEDASGIIDATYDRMKQVNQVKETYEGLLNKGRQADAEKYLKENIDEMALASVAGSFKQYMGQITEYERQIRASNMTPEKKREALDQARKAKIQLATSVRAAADKKAPQAAPA
jgi:hypothetical protein